MSGDITVLNESLYGSMKVKTENRTASTHDFTLKPGEVVEKGVTGAVAASGNFAVLALTASPVEATNLFLGIVKQESDETSTVDGHANIHLVGFGTRLKGKATTPGNMDTVAKLNGIELDCVTFDGIAAKGDSPVTTPYTIDENEGDDPNAHGLQILYGDITLGTLEVRVVGGTNFFGSGI